MICFDFTKIHEVYIVFFFTICEQVIFVCILYKIYIFLEVIIHQASKCIFTYILNFFDSECDVI